MGRIKTKASVWPTGCSLPIPDRSLDLSCNQFEINHKTLVNRTGYNLGKTWHPKLIITGFMRMG